MAGAFQFTVSLVATVVVLAIGTAIVMDVANIDPIHPGPVTVGGCQIGDDTPPEHWYERFRLPTDAELECSRADGRRRGAAAAEAVNRLLRGGD